MRLVIDFYCGALTRYDDCLGFSHCAGWCISWTLF